jgi:hypothetical protein
MGYARYLLQYKKSLPPEVRVSFDNKPLIIVVRHCDQIIMNEQINHHSIQSSNRLVTFLRHLYFTYIFKYPLFNLRYVPQFVEPRNSLNS